MKYKPYPKYKPSGIDWIGEIPEGWNTVSLRWISRRYAGGTPDSSNDSYWLEGTIPWINSGTVNQKLIEEPTTYITEDAYRNSSARWVPKNALVMALAGQGKTKGMVAQLAIDSTCNQSMAAIIPDGARMMSRYLFWWLTSRYKNIRGLAGNEIRDGLNLEMVGSMPCPTPPLAEQKSISDFLDQKTAQIDDLIQKKEEMIKLLKEKRAAIINQAVTKGLDPNAKMTPSGIDWIGDIPEGWGIRRLKFLSKIISKGTTPSTIGREILSDGNIRFLKAENIQEGEIKRYPEFFIDEETNKLLKRSELKEEDILFVIAGATIGKAGLLKKEFLPANTNQAVSFVRLVKGVNKKFILYWLQSVYIKRLTWLNAVQSAQPNLSMESLGDFAIPYPGTKDEQQQITNYLNAKTERMDSLIQIIESAIAKLHEYRSSLITAAVTGKIDVREVVNDK